MADVSVEFGATDTGLSETLKGIRESMKNLETQQRTTAMSTDEVEKSMRELKKLQGMEKLFMDLSGETAKLAEAEKIATEATRKLVEEEKAAAQATKKLADEIAAADIKKLADEEKAAIEATKKLAAEEEILAKTQEKMNQPLLTTSERLGLVRTQMEYLKEKAATASLQAHELDETMKKLGELSKTEKALSAIAGDVEKVGKESTATSPKVDELGKDMKTAGDKAEDAGKKGKTGFGEIAIGAGIAGAAVKLGTAAIDAAFAVAQKTVQSFGDALSMGGRLKDLADRTGIAIDKILILERAFHNAGVGAEAVGPIVNKMQKAIVDASDGSTKAADAFSQLGLSLSDLEKMSPEDQLRTIGKAIASIPNEADRAAISMEVFGKSGGALNQLFADMDGGIETAKKQLGSLPALMKSASEQFDRIDENLFSVGQKFVEFAAGLLDKVAPALDAVTTALSMIDAAGIGQSIGDFFIGAGEGMKGFQAAVDAIDAGDMMTAFKIAAQAIQIQFKETANSIYTNIVAAFSTVAEFAGKIFDPSGALGQTIVQAFAFIGNKASAAIMGALGEAMKGSYLTRGMGEALTEMSKKAEETAKKAEGDLKGAGGRIADQFVEAGAAMPDSFDKNYNKIPPLFTDIEKHQKEIDSLQEGITRSTKETTAAISDQAKEDAKAEQEARKYFQDHKKFQEDQEKANAKKTADQEAANKLKQGELKFQLEIAEAQAAGDTERVTALQASKKYAEDVQKALAAGLNPEQAALFATNMAIAANNSANIKQYDKDGNQLFFKAAENAEKLHRSLKSATGFADTLANMKEIKVMDKAANSAKAVHTELLAADKLLGTNFAQMSMPDLVKKLNIDKIGQTGEEQLRAVATYFNGIKTDLSQTPINTEKGQADILNLVKFFGGNPMKADLVINHDEAKKSTDTAFSKVEATLDAEKSVKGLRDSVKDGIELDVAAKSGVSGLLDAIKSLVTTISTATTSINGKLPIAVVGA